MELKYTSNVTKMNYMFVLIVPLWNWNSEALTERASDLHVLIVPLWNWNSISPLSSTEGASFNCTFMELKYSKVQAVCYAWIVLIVPLWNWNIFDKAPKTVEYEF